MPLPVYTLRHVRLLWTVGSEKVLMNDDHKLSYWCEGTALHVAERTEENGTLSIKICESSFCQRRLTSFYTTPSSNSLKIVYLFIYFGLKLNVSYCTGLERPWGFHDCKAPRISRQSAVKVVMLLSLCTGRLYLPGNISSTHFC